MALPGFSAESSVRRARGTYRAAALHSPRAGTVLPALDTVCTGCAAVGGFGGIRGIGRRSCCRQSWVWNPATRRLELTSTCWFESCGPEPSRSLLAF